MRADVEPTCGWGLPAGRLLRHYLPLDSWMTLPEDLEPRSFDPFAGLSRQHTAKISQQDVGLLTPTTTTPSRQVNSRTTLVSGRVRFTGE
jgi:hypothetical protein